MNTNGSISNKMKRLVAMTLVLAMMLTTLGDAFPGRLSAYADELETASQPQDFSVYAEIGEGMLLEDEAPALMPVEDVLPAPADAAAAEFAAPVQEAAPVPVAQEAVPALEAAAAAEEAPVPAVAQDAVPEAETAPVPVEAAAPMPAAESAVSVQETVPAQEAAPAPAVAQEAAPAVETAPAPVEAYAPVPAAQSVSPAEAAAPATSSGVEEAPSDAAASVKARILVAAETPVEEKATATATITAVFEAPVEDEAPETDAAAETEITYLENIPSVYREKSTVEIEIAETFGVSVLPQEAAGAVPDGLDAENIQTDIQARGDAVSYNAGFSGLMETIPKLKAMIQEALKSQKALDHKVQVKLDRETTYSDDVTLDAEEWEDLDIEEGFELELVAEDAGEDYLQSSGSTVINGDLEIKGISVRMAGIVMAAGKGISIAGAKSVLQYYGTGEDDAVKVDVSEGARAEIHTGAGNDEVEVSVTGAAEGEEDEDGKTIVDTGDDDDTVTAEVSNKGAVEIRTGEGDDEVKTVSETGGTVTVETGAGGDTVEAEVRMQTGDIIIRSGSDDDTVNLVNTADGDSALATDGAGTVEVDLGTGIDEANISTDIAGSVKSVTVQGGTEDSSDRVHLTGELDEEEDDPISGTRENLTLSTENGLLQVVLSHIESLTDDLGNKTTVQLTPVDGKLIYDKAESFVNYEITIPADEIREIIMRRADNQALVLSSLVINTDTEADGENRLIVSEGSSIDAQGMNLQLTARNILVNGTLKADTVQLEALDGTGMHTRNFTDQFAARKSAVPIAGIGDAAGAVVAGVDMLWDMVNIRDRATVEIGKTGRVYASGDVIMLAKVEQTAGLISSLAELNVVDVKLADAHIDIAGKVYAGYDFETGKVEEGLGSVKADAQVSTTMGYNEDGEVFGGMPLAVSVAVADASVNVAQGAEIEAASNIALNAKSDLKVSTRSDSGLGGAPVSIAVAVLLNDAHAKVDGSLTAGHDVKVTADGSLDASSIADRGEGHESISGGYVAVTVAMQDVKAEVAEHAVVKAVNGTVQVSSSATEKVDNKAASSAQDSEEDTAEDGAPKKVLNILKNVVWPKIRDYIEDDSAQKKLDEQIKKLVTSDHSVKLDDNAASKGEVKVIIDEGASTDDAVTGKIEVMPRSGYKVKSITWRGYNAGDSTYQTGRIETTNGAFIFKVQYVTVFVEYEEDTGSQEQNNNNDLFRDSERSQDEIDIERMVQDATSGTDDEMNVERDFQEIEREIDEREKPKLELTLPADENGAVLTYETDPEDPEKCLKTVKAGQKVRLIPNPAAGKMLREGGLKVTYSVDEQGTSVLKKEVVNPDDKGRYFFTLPTNLEGKEVIVTAEFEDRDQDADADETQNQGTGAIAVVVSGNDGNAVIDTGASVVADSVSVEAKNGTDISNLADGTSVSKESAGGKEEEDDLSIERPEESEYSYHVTGQTYGLMLAGTQNGTVAAEKSAGTNRPYVYTFTAVPEEGYSVASAMLTYYSNGERMTKKLNAVRGEDGKYTVEKEDLEALNMDRGSTAQVSFAFASEKEETEVVSSHPAQTVIRNPIQISYNSEKQGSTDLTHPTGTVYFDAETTEDEDGNPVYSFKVAPNGGNGYVLDGELKATWVTSSGAEKMVTLTNVETKTGAATDQWLLDVESIPEGVPVTISAVFKQDLHDFKVDTENTKNGTVTLHDEQLKCADNPKITVTPDAGYSVKNVAVTYTNSHGITKTINLTDKDSKISKVDGKEDVYTFEVENLGADTEITVNAEFELKTIGLFAGAGDAAEDFSLSEKNAAKGDEVSVTASEEKIKAGYKVTEVTVKNESGTTVTTGTDTFTVPDDTDETAKLTVTAKLELKEIPLEEASFENGTVKANIARADRNEKVTVTVTPKADFKVKSGTLKAVVKTTDGSYSEEVFMTRVNDTTYTFYMPVVEDPSKVKVTFTGEFEPGQFDSSGVDTSLGAGIAVTVADSENNTSIRGSVEAAGDIALKAEAENSVSTESLAGYSKGNIGVGGAVSVQVASADSKVRVYREADLKLDGTLELEAGNTVAYKVNADASGSQDTETEKVGVGAGIAVAVSSADTVAAVEDGTRLAAAEEKIGGVSLTVTSAVKDEVTAKAGASGGTSAVPVAAVDVISTAASASVGDTAADKLILSGDLSISAVNEAEHEISADASAAGKGAGIGISAAVSVVFDEATAILKESAEAGHVTVASENVSSVTETASASASGGETEGKSADEQADGLLDGAARLAGSNQSGNLDAGRIDSAMRDRQQAETSEGTVGVAGAVAVNVQFSTSRSEIVDNVNVKAEDLIAVTSSNNTAARVKGNASVTNSDVGVGVGVAVNVVLLENIAHMGNGEFEAAMLTLSATTKEIEPEKEYIKAEEVEDTDGLAAQFGAMVGEYINNLVREMGLDKYGLSEDLLGEIIDPVVTDITDELIKATGLNELFGDGDLNAKYDKAKEMLSNAKDGLLSLPEKLAEPFMDIIGDVVDLKNLSGDDWKTIRDDLIEEFTNQLKNNSINTGRKILSSVKDGMLEYIDENILIF